MSSERKPANQQAPSPATTPAALFHDATSGAAQAAVRIGNSLTSLTDILEELRLEVEKAATEAGQKQQSPSTGQKQQSPSNSPSR